VSILFLSEMSKESGLGHWLRCYRLAQILDAEGHRIHFIFDALIKDKDIFVPTDFISKHTISSTITDISIITELKVLIQNNSIKLIIIDGYGFTSDYRKSLADLGLPIVAFDDINDCSNYHCNLLINTGNNAESIDYTQSAQGARLCLGAEYQVLSQPYINCRNTLNNAFSASSNRDGWLSRNAISIIMGGADTQDLTLPLLETLSGLDWGDNIPIFNIVTTNLYPALNDIRAFIDDSSLQMTHIHQNEDLSSVFMASRLAISAAGGTIYELQACATPSILICLAENQMEAARQAEKSGFAIGFNYLGTSSLESVGQLCHNIWFDSDALNTMHATLMSDYQITSNDKLLTAINSLL